MNKLDYNKYAKLAFDTLIKRTQDKSISWKFIFYSELAKDINFPLDKLHTEIGTVLGTIGDAISKLKKTNPEFKDIPYIMILVINKATLVPGKGIEKFIIGWDKMNITQQTAEMNKIANDVCKYKKWDEVSKKINFC